MSVIITTNMGLTLPEVGEELGPQYGFDNNSSLTTVDGHDHSPGSGVHVTPNGLNINADLPINSNNLTLVKTVNFSAQSAPLAGVAPNLGCVYVAGNELYYNDENGNVVAITNNGSVNAGAGSITGLPSGTASASYSSGSGTFIWQSATSTAADMDFGSAIIREKVASAKGITISSPTGLPADYTLTLPSAPPASLLFMAENNTGNISFISPDNVTVELSGSTLRVKDAGITNAKIADSTITFIKNAPRVQNNPAAIGEIAISTTPSGTALTQSTSYIDLGSLSVTITTNGGPVMLSTISDQSGLEADLVISGNVSASFRFFRDNTTAINQYIIQPNSASSFYLPCIQGIDFPPAGTHTYTVQGFTSNASFSIGFTNTCLMAYEL